ncbi:hypothetical protein YN1_7490 [Nanoarchaeota archaeon]
MSFWDYGRKPWKYLELIKNIEGYKLIFAGNWRIKSLREKIIRKIKEEKLEDKVELRENVSESELNNLYDKSKFLIRFGFGEYGPSMLVIESIQHTTPVIINDELGTADLVNNYKIGLVTKGLDFNSIKKFIEEVDEGKYKEMQDNIKKVQKIYSWENHTKKLVESII